MKLHPTVQTNYHLNEDRDFINYHLENFKQQTNIKNGPIVSLSAKTTGIAIELIKEIEHLVGNDAVVNYMNANTIEFYSSTAYASLELHNQNLNIFDTTVINFEVIIYSDYANAQRIYEQLKTKYKSDGPNVCWYFRDSDGDLQYSNFDLANDKTVHPEFYPFIKNIDTFGERYLKSDSNVLILLGPPGTGKTSFIRDMLLKLNQGAITTYDEDIMNMDKFYIRYLNAQFNFIVLEDADLLLQTRDKDDNRVMSKILNTSDGLVSTKDKKFIFTANITQESKIDEALIRPGRCFDVIHFRKLTHKEAVAAARAADLTAPEANGEDKALAELFNVREQPRKRAPRLGFI